MICYGYNLLKGQREMVKITFRIVCSVICLLLVRSVFSGCTRGTVTSEDGNPNSSTTSATTATTKPEPSPTPIAIIQHSCTLNHYALTEDAQKYLGEYASDYKGFVDAIMNYQQDYTFSSTKSKERSLSVINQFPLFILCESFDCDFSSPVVEINYKIDRNRFEADVQNFCSGIEAVLFQNINSTMTDTEKVLSIYSLISSYKFTDSDISDTYSFLTNKDGMAFTKGLSFFLNQMNVPNLIIFGMVDGTTHMWNTIKLGNNYYHFDTAFEGSATAGSGLNYFGMSDSRRIKTGCTQPFSTGENGYCSLIPTICDNTSLDSIFSSVTSWKLDGEEHILYLAYNNSDCYSSAVDTVAFEPIYS